MNTWQLPAGISQITGKQALAFETLRRQLLDLYASRGFELVIPPMVEYTESLTLNAETLNLKTFQFLDPASGKMLGVHADITPQIARIDAKRNSTKIEKYCYINAILQTCSDDFYTSRSPIQTGAELYGDLSISADVELIELMLESLNLLDISPIVLSLSNIALFNALIDAELLSAEQKDQLRQIFKTQSTPDLAAFLQNNSIKNAPLFTALINLKGGKDVLNESLGIFAKIPEAIAAIKDLMAIGQQLDGKNIEVIYDLAQLKVYEYHTGIVFCAYHIDYPKALAQGGRYNNLGKSCKQSEIDRAASGFSFDLKFLAQ